MAMDPRIARTRTRLREALFALARERGLDEISISDIAERADVNRSTFYQHYSDKDTLLADALDAVIEETIDAAEQHPITEIDGSRLLLHYLHHVHENADLYRRLFGASGSAAVQVRTTERLQQILEPYFIDGVPTGLDGIPVPVAAAAVAGSALATLRAWLALSPLPPPEDAASWVLTAILSHGRVPQ